MVTLTPLLRSNQCRLMKFLLLWCVCMLQLKLSYFCLPEYNRSLLKTSIVRSMLASSWQEMLPLSHSVSIQVNSQTQSLKYALNLHTAVIRVIKLRVMTFYCLFDSSISRTFSRGYPNLMRSYGGLREPRGSNLTPLKSTFNAEHFIRRFS